jgi:phosphatidylglycerophosphatase A
MEKSINPNRNKTRDGVALLIATGLGVGYCPIAPGTVGSALGIVLIVLFSRFNFMGGQRLLFYLIVVGVISAVGVWAATRAEALLGKKDPPQVVIDEVVGQLLTFGLLFRQPRAGLLVVGFLLFRLFDIFKPFPIRKLEEVRHGFGIMLDDLAAGFYASLIIFVLHHWIVPTL